MRQVHFKEANLAELDSCFLDPQGNFLFLDKGKQEIGVHEELAGEILDARFGEDFEIENWEKIHEGRHYLYEYFEEELGYFRYSHWVGEYGVFNGEKDKMTFAQKLAIKEFC